MKNPVTKTVRVIRPKAGVLFQMPPVEPNTIGYVVRYENGGVHGGMSQPLDVDFDYSPTGILLINPDGPGTIFPTFDGAKDAVIKSITYQTAHNLRWNCMYGDYLISPVVAR